MKTKEVIRQLMENDPSGEEEVCVGNVDIHFIAAEPAYYDGALQVLERDPTTKYYNIIGGKYRRKGTKVVIHTLSITDALGEAGNKPFPIDYSELSEDRQEATKKAHEALREWHKQLENRLEWENFLKWSKGKAEKLTADTEDVERTARYFFEKNVDRNDPFPEGGVPTGHSYNTMRIMQWEQKFDVVMEEGFLKFKKKEQS